MNNEVKRPMLATAVEDTSKLPYPMFVSVKLDGLRCTVQNGKLYSRSGKPIQSPVAQELFGSSRFEGMDGELIYGDMFAKDVFQKTTSAVMSKTWPDELDKTQLHFYVFDKFPRYSAQPYVERYVEICQALDGVAEFDKIPAFAVVQTLVRTEEELLAVENQYLQRGAEGLMPRLPNAPYKHGRSTLKEAYILKLKRFSDAEAIVIGFDEKMHNTNEAKKDAFGHTERSTCKENLIPANTLGALLVKDCVSGVEFGIGSGFDDKLRKEIWDNKESWLGKIVKYQYFATGMKEETMAPRFPTFKGERSKDDM